MGWLPTYGLNKVGDCTRAQLQITAIFLKPHCLPNGTRTLATFPADIAATQPPEEEHGKYLTATGVLSFLWSPPIWHARQLKWKKISVHRTGEMLPEETGIGWLSLGICKRCLYPQCCPPCPKANSHQSLLSDQHHFPYCLIWHPVVNSPTVLQNKAKKSHLKQALKTEMH